MTGWKQILASRLQNLIESHQRRVDALSSVESQTESEHFTAGKKQTVSGRPDKTLKVIH